MLSPNSRRDRPALVLLLVILVSACATSAAPVENSPGPSASITDTETGGMFRLGSDSKGVGVAIEATPAEVWAALPAVYEKLGINPELNDSSAHTIGTRGFSASRLGGKRTTDWVRCGNDGAGPSAGGMSRTRLSIVSTVRPARDGLSELVTEVGGSATRVEGTSTGAIACASRGELEQHIRDLVLEEIVRKRNR